MPKPTLFQLSLDGVTGISNALDISTVANVVGIIMPTNWTPAVVTLDGSADGVTFYPIHEGRTGTELSFNVKPNTMVAIDPNRLRSCMAIRLRSGSHDTPPIPQGTPRNFTVVAESVASSAAPFDAMAFSGMQINGSMEVSQELGTSGTTAASATVCDGWKIYRNGTMVLGAYQGATSFVPGFPYQLYQTVNTAQASIAAGDLAFIYQMIEGWRCARLGWGTANAQPITIAFWSSHVRTGIYSVAVRNGVSTRSYVATYNHIASNVAQYNVITIPGDTAGTWSTDNTASLVISIALAVGSTYVAPAANTWSNGNYLAAPGQVNGVAATSDAFRITGLIVLPGIEAPSAARSALIMRPYDQELQTCRRYWKTNGELMGHWQENSATQAQFTVEHSPPMRIAPNVAVLATASRIARHGLGTYNIGSATAAAGNTPTGTFLDINTATAVINVPAHLVADTISFDARL